MLASIDRGEHPEPEDGTPLWPLTGNTSKGAEKKRFQQEEEEDQEDIFLLDEEDLGNLAEDPLVILVINSLALDASPLSIDASMVKVGNIS